MFIDPADTRWKELLANTHHDVYHLSGFAGIEARLLRGEAMAWYYETNQNAFLIPLVSRKIEGDHTYRDLVSPYGYPGILSRGPADLATAANILSLFNKEAAAHGFVSSFLRLNPLINSWQLPQTESWRQWFHGGTVSVDLSLTMEQLRQSFSENHRRHLRKARALGYTSSINDWKHLPSFIEAYRQTMKRRNAHPYYFFPDEYFNQLQHLLGDKLMLVSVLDSDGNWASGGMFTVFGEVMQYHLGATPDAHMPVSPSKLMIEAAIEAGKAMAAVNMNSVKMLHLGGGLGGSTTDGLFRFKKGFGLNYHPYTSLRFIHLPAVYENLRKALGKGYNRNTYFPEYRVVIEE